MRLEWAAKAIKAHLFVFRGEIRFCVGIAKVRNCSAFPATADSQQSLSAHQLYESQRWTDGWIPE